MQGAGVGSEANRQMWDAREDFSIAKVIHCEL